MIFFRLIKDKEVILSNCESLKEELLRSSTTRMVSRFFSECEVQLFGTDYDYKILANKHIADKTAEAYVRLIKVRDDLKSDYKSEYAILSHNLITSYSLLQDALGRIIPEEGLAKAENHAEQINIVEKILNSNQQLSAEALLAVVKRVADLQAQIGGLKILSGNNRLDLGNHNIKKVLQNIIFPFYEDFKKNNITIRWRIDYDLAELHQIKTDYKILNVALHQLLNNAVKYTMPYSHIDISFDDDERRLIFDMDSIKIEPDEIDRIFELRYRGKNVKKIDAGEGIGMYMAKKALDLLNVTILVHPKYENEQADILQNKYTRNKFILVFPKS